jgi:hypothetical protein
MIGNSQKLGIAGRNCWNAENAAHGDDITEDRSLPVTAECFSTCGL